MLGMSDDFGFVNHEDMLPRHVHPCLGRQIDIIDSAERSLGFLIQLPRKTCIGKIDIFSQRCRDTSWVDLSTDLAREQSKAQTDEEYAQITRLHELAFRLLQEVAGLNLRADVSIVSRDYNDGAEILYLAR